MRRARISLMFAAVALVLPASLFAQFQLPDEASPLAAIKRLFCANFDQDPVFAAAVGGVVITPVSTNLVNSFVFQGTTFPSVSSATGFTFSWVGGAPVASEVYGPLFGERAQTNGKKQLSGTLSYQRLSWSTYDGQEIRTSQRGLEWGDSDPVGLVPSDQYVGVCNLNVNSDVVLLALNYGLSRRLDISAALPLVRTSVSGTSDFEAVGPETVGNIPPQSYAARGEATGIGDLGFAAKLGVLDTGPLFLALRGGVVIGTGSADKMTGAGQTVYSGVMAAAWEKGRASVHGQLGYSKATGDPQEGGGVAGVGVSDEFNYVVGVDYSPVPERLTLGAELVARRLVEMRGFDADSLTATTDDINVYFLSAGGKVRVVQRVLLSAYLLVPAGNTGLLPRKPSFNAGINYVF